MESRNAGKPTIGNNPAFAEQSSKLRLAGELHRRGQLAQAGAVYEEILKAQPKNFDALHLLGVIAAQTGNPQRAANLIGKAIKINPKQAAPYCNRGAALHELKKLDAALASFDQAIALNPEYAMAFCNRGNVLKELKRFAAALASFDRAIAIDSNFAEAYSNRGNVYCELEQWDAALVSYELAIAHRPGYAEAHFNRGNALKALQRFELALASFDKAIALNPRYAAAHCNRGNTLKALQRFDAALESYGQAVALKPDYADAHFNRGNLLKELRRFDEALASFDLAVAVKPHFAEAHLNRGAVLKDLRRLDEAVACCDRAIAIKPDFAEAYVNRATTLLLRGDLQRGWHDYEWRWKSPKGPNFTERRSFSQPLWIGKDSIAGQTILLYGEQGLGDTLQFCRYATLVSALGATVIVEAQPPLLGLLGSLKGVSRVVAKGDSLPSFDRHCPLLSLPLAFKTTMGSIPGANPYLFSDPNKVASWQARLGEKSRPRIGLAWSGNPRQVNNHNRSLSLSDLIAHLPPRFQYVSLQKEVPEDDRNVLERSPSLLNVADHLQDFSDTAALCECLDVVISVDTSVAHLSAALGRPTWVLLHHNPDWRWLLERDDSPWYPTVTLHRQRRYGNWPDVIERAAAALDRGFP